MSQVESISNDQILACFDQAMEQTFEAFFFSEAVRKPDDLKVEFCDKDRIEVELIFRGPFSGHLHLQVTRSTAAALVGSLPLPNTEICDSVISDLFAELTNTVGGRIAAALAGSDFAFDLTIPEVKFGSSAVHPNGLSRAYDTDFGPVILSVSHLKESKSEERKGA
ncbi:MAG: chemotaxis protein CheX [Proteobacteria bacterium]|nr:MAG: chemotaxis protein CheX [Pseudomonadota bacterium]